MDDLKLDPHAECNEQIKALADAVNQLKTLLANRGEVLELFKAKLLDTQIKLLDAYPPKPGVDPSRTSEATGGTDHPRAPDGAPI